MNKTIAAIDLKAFYSFVECIDRGLDPFSTPLVVCDIERGKNTIVLSVSPYLKQMGVPSRCRKSELPKLDNMIYAVPRMSRYLDRSSQVISVILDFVGQDDLHIYSIDEVFINIGPYLKLNNCTAYEFSKRILDKIKSTTGLICTCGIAPNIFLAKCAMDIEAKKNSNFMAEWTNSNFKEKFWNLPVGEMWGVSRGYNKKLNSLGIKTIGDLAKFKKDSLKFYYGVIGEEMWEHANGIDDSDIREKYFSKDKSLSLGQMLMRDYSKNEAKLLVMEMIDDLSLRLRKLNKKAEIVGLLILYSSEEDNNYHRQIALNIPTQESSELYKALEGFYDKEVDNRPIRGIGISFSKLCSSKFDQMDIFAKEENSKEKKIVAETIDSIKEKYGKNAILRGSSLLSYSTAILRHNQIGGHKK